jgi:hypothetical protein
MLDAAMLDAVCTLPLELDVWGKERVEGGRRGLVLGVCDACVMCHVVLCGGCTVALLYRLSVCCVACGFTLYS